MLLQRNSSLVIVIVGPDRNLKILKALFKSQAHQGTSLFTRAATNLSRIRHCLPKCTLQGLYYSLMFPYLSYCSLSWGCNYTSRLKSLKTLQKRALRIFHMPALSQYSKHIIYCTMKMLLNINLVYSCTVTTINYFDDYFCQGISIHKYNTRY